VGTIGNDKEVIKLKINISEQDKKNDQEYFVSGYSVVENNYSKFEGKLKINISEQDKKNDQEYFVSGYTVVENNYSKFEGKFKITKYKDSKSKGVVYGDYELVEEVKGKHSGIFTGKFIYTFKWNKTSEKIQSQYIELIGDWKSYDKTLDFKTRLKNQ